MIIIEEIIVFKGKNIIIIVIRVKIEILIRIIEKEDLTNGIKINDMIINLNI